MPSVTTVLLAGLPDLATLAVQVLAVVVTAIFLLGLAAVGYKLVISVERPKDVLFEEVDEEEGLRTGGEDEEWDYY